MSKKHHKVKKTYSSSKGIAWLYSEVCALLEVWSEGEIQRQLSGRLHNMCVYERISRHLQGLGIDRTAEQCREKIKKLKRDYKVVMDNNYSPAFARKLLGCYDKVHEVFTKCRVLSKSATNSTSKDDEKFDEEDNFSYTCDSLLETENNNTNNGRSADNSSAEENNTDVSMSDGSSEADDSSVSDQDMEDDSFSQSKTDKCVQIAFESFSKSRENFRTKYMDMELSQLKRDIEREKQRLKLLEMKRHREHQREYRMIQNLLALVANHCNNNQ